MEKALLVIDRKRRRFLGIKRGQALELAPCFQQLHAASHHRGHRQTQANLFKDGGGKSHKDLLSDFAPNKAQTANLLGGPPDCQKLIPAILYHALERLWMTVDNLHDHIIAQPTRQRGQNKGLGEA